MTEQLPPPGGPIDPVPTGGQPVPPPPASAPVPPAPAYAPSSYTNPGGATPATPPAEYLEQGAGTPLPTAPEQPRRTGRRVALLAGTGVGLAALGSAGAWAFLALNGGGPQPAEALPASTWAYVSVDFDPSASQKIEAVKTLNKFPALKKELGLDPQDDIVEKLVEKALAESPCDHFSYAADMKPWLGQRAAVAAVSLGKDQVPVGVLQVTDAQAAADGLRAVAACAANGDAEQVSGVDTRWVVADGWAYIAEDADTARRVADAAASGSLADDADYTDWMDRVGVRGIVTAYAAPEAGTHLADLLEQNAAGLGADDLGMTPSPMTGMADQMRGQLGDFPGMAATVRFNDGGLELEAVGAAPAGGAAAGVMSTRAGEVVTSLPNDTLAAVGMSLQPGWLSSYADQLATMAGATCRQTTCSPSWSSRPA
ncbi:MAG: DUF3352 domain-containing protein [Nocardioides sp.]